MRRNRVLSMCGINHCTNRKVQTWTLFLYTRRNWHRRTRAIFGYESNNTNNFDLSEWIRATECAGLDPIWPIAFCNMHCLLRGGHATLIISKAMHPLPPTIIMVCFYNVGLNKTTNYTVMHVPNTNLAKELTWVCIKY